MYQADWPKIQARLEHGEQIENIIQEYTGVFTAVVMKEAKVIFDTVTREFIEIMRQALLGENLPRPESTAQTRETAARRGRTTTQKPSDQSTFSTPTSILTSTNRSSGIRQKAGASQIVQRTFLIKQIQQWRLQLRQFEGLVRSGSRNKNRPGSNYTQHLNAVTQFKGLIAEGTRGLQALQAKYKF